MNTFLLYTSGYSCKTELHIDFDRKFVEDIIDKICNDDTSGDTEKLCDIVGAGKENMRSDVKEACSTVNIFV